MKITLQRPPSTNQIYKYTNRGGYARSYISERGQSWFETEGYKLKRLAPKIPYEGEVSVYIVFFCCGLGDIDGILKPLLDLFQKVGVIANDRQVNFLQVTREAVKTRKEESVHIEIPEL